MLNKRYFLASFFTLAIFGSTAAAQRQTPKMDPEIMNYKLSMEKVRAMDGVVRKLLAASKTDAGLQSAFQASRDKRTLAEMVSSVESNPKLISAIKAGGLTAQEFCVIPMGIMAAGGAYMVQTQYKKDVSTLATKENVAFYGAHKDEIEKITNAWSTAEGN
jgi:hypothetical protein